ncbi:hypothetical protein RND71_004336 [Anisodus tanguticus]|uniref:Uncharacterized protein n=1 Tax=Anisodus tanguticus TaxID=243964 RepID=A0AAE1VXM6_9SOLA|nr:hypothetical protein RND71_004336 [Anisodus tanguticus]
MNDEDKNQCVTHNVRGGGQPVRMRQFLKTAFADGSDPPTRDGCSLFYNRHHDYLCHFDCAAITEFLMESDSMAKLQNRLKTLAITNRPPARASLTTPKTLTLADVNYELFFSFPFIHEKADIKCNICSELAVTKDCMLYYNMERDVTLHVACALTKESGNNKEVENNLSIQRLNELSIAD